MRLSRRDPGICFRAETPEQLAKESREKYNEKEYCTKRLAEMQHTQKGRRDMLLLNKDEIRQVFSMKDAIEADKNAYKLFSEGKAEVPLRTVIRTADGDSSFCFMPSYSDGMKAAGIKIVNIFPGNKEKDLPTTVGQVLLIDGETGAVSALMDGTFVTALRTGAASGAAFDFFGRGDARYGALIGTGSQAECQLEAMMAARQLKQIRVAARDFEKTKVFVERMQLVFGDSYDTEIKAVRDTNEAIADADLITCVTTSGKPTFDAGIVKKGAVLSGVGSYLPDMQELDPAIFDRAGKIYFDSRDAVLAESGDVQRPMAAGTLKESQFTGDIGEYILGKVPGRESEDEIIVFKNVGLGILDLVAAAEIYGKADAAGVGMRWGE